MAPHKPAQPSIRAQKRTAFMLLTTLYLYSHQDACNKHGKICKERRGAAAPRTTITLPIYRLSCTFQHTLVSIYHLTTLLYHMELSSMHCNTNLTQNSWDMVEIFLKMAAPIPRWPQKVNGLTAGTLLPSGVRWFRWVIVIWIRVLSSRAKWNGPDHGSRLNQNGSA